MIFGDTLLPHGVTLGLREPQGEIAVWLYGLGEPIDVTERISMACAAPFTICIAFEEYRGPNEEQMRRLRLKFCERNGQRRVLGELSLRPAGRVPVHGSRMLLFEISKTKSHCLPLLRLWAHDLLRAWKNWRRTDPSALAMSLGGMRAMTVMFIRPHAVALGSHSDAGGNIFPMNLMGELGNGHFAFALVNKREAALGVERAGRIALSSVPFPQAAIAFQLAPNHFREAADWDALPFETKASATFDLPVPAFASRVRELEILHSRPLGSHRFFVARVVQDTGATECENLHVENLHIIDGIYHAWRIKGREAERKASLTADSLNKQGAYSG
jgi:hypothetical protein